MPKIVDHDQRRIEIVRASWRIVSEIGIDKATMREIAAEAGFANGAIKPYFSTKDELFTFSYEFVFAETNSRMAASTHGLRGLAALRAACLEILPTDDVKVSEARIVIPFWQQSLNDADKYRVHEAQMGGWRTRMRGYLVEAQAAGEISRGLDLDLEVGVLLNFVLGAQVTATLTPEQQPAAQLIAQLDELLTQATLARTAAPSSR